MQIDDIEAIFQPRNNSISFFRLLHHDSQVSNFVFQYVNGRFKHI